MYIGQFTIDDEGNTNIIFEDLIAIGRATFDQNRDVVHSGVNKRKSFLVLFY